MRESIFKFKQFSVKNSLSAMKVGTDGVLLGAWCNVENVICKSILDVGAGTGLISLMVAQRSLAKITGIEISPTAANEAEYNIALSKWHDRISIINEDFNEYLLNNTLKFDHVISNPPYFETGIKSKQSDRAIARHVDCLSYKDLICGSFQILNDSGLLSIITPYDMIDKITEITNDCGFYVSRITDVCPKVNHQPKRRLWEFSKHKKETIHTTIAIEKERHDYTNEYIQLTKAYYLKM